jgi:GNAT superfamily N-acetyltransferase
MARAADISVRQVAEDEWRLWRELRLAALEEAPYAFGSTHAETLGRDEAWWRSWWTDQVAGARFIVTRDGSPAGMCALCYPQDSGGLPLLISMWVAPEARGSGVAPALLAAVEDWARDAGDEALLLDVVGDNRAASRLYERSGYRATGDIEPLRSNPAKELIRMSRSLS